MDKIQKLKNDIKTFEEEIKNMNLTIDNINDTNEKDALKQTIKFTMKQIKECEDKIKGLTNGKKV